NVVNIFWVNPGIVQRPLHGADRAFAFGIEGSHMIRVRRLAVAHYLRVDVSAALPSMFEALQDQDSAALAVYEPAAVRIEGAARFRRAVLEALGQHGHRVKGYQGVVGEYRFDAAGQHNVGLAEPDHIAGAAN